MNPKFLKLLCLSAILSAGNSFAQLPASDNLFFDAVTLSVGSDFSISFTDNGTGSENYVLEHTPQLGTDADWQVDDNATLQTLGGGRFTFTTSKPQEFGVYRIIGYGPAGEQSAEFTVPSISLEESDGLAYVDLVFSQPYTGTVTYTVEGPASGSVISPLSGSLNVNGQTTARITLELSDDLSIGELQFLALTLNSDGIGAGTNNRVVITVEENDAIWTGVFVSDHLEFNFEIELLEDSSGHVANLVSNGNGVIPSGTYPASVTFTEQMFNSSVSNIEIPAGSSLINSPSVMSLSLTSTNGNGEDLVADDRIQGQATISTAYAALLHLNTEISGQFGLVKTAVNPSSAEVTLE